MARELTTNEAAAELNVTQRAIQYHSKKHDIGRVLPGGRFGIRLFNGLDMRRLKTAIEDDARARTPEGKAKRLAKKRKAEALADSAVGASADDAGQADHGETQVDAADGDQQQERA